MNTETLYQHDRTLYWHSFTQMADYEPLVVERAEGVWLYDVEGRRLLDGASSMWCNVHGHNHPTINSAIERQLHRVAHATSLGMSCNTTIEFAKRLVDITPEGLEHVFFSSDGSSANEVAIKAAFQYWRQCGDPQPQKTKYLAFGQAYHGDTIGAASVGGIGKFHAIFRPLLFDVIQAPQPKSPESRVESPELEEVNATDDRSANIFLGKVEQLLQRHHHELAAMIVEPLVQGAAGMVIQPPGFVRSLRELADKYNVLLILDEVATGFGRTGTMFACEQENVSPDFLCLGKGLTGGYLPMAATLTTPRIWETFLGDADRALYHGHTYSGNPLAAAAGLASLEVFEQEQTLANLPSKIKRLGERLAGLADHPHVANPRQCGMIVAFDLEGRGARGEELGKQVAKAALERGVWLRARDDMAYAMPPLSTTLEEIDILMDAMGAACNELS